MTKRPYAQESVLIVSSGSETDAPGAAITVALCGHWEHPPPCPLAPHYTSASADGDRLVVRTLFAAEPDDEGEVRTRIRSALAAGPAAPGWQFVSSEPVEVRDTEAEHAQRLIIS